MQVKIGYQKEKLQESARYVKQERQKCSKPKDFDRRELKSYFTNLELTLLKKLTILE